MKNVITFTNGSIEDIAISESSITFVAKWSSTFANVRITRTPNGYFYEDLGFMTRNFDSIPYLCWEFNYPENILRPILEGLIPTEELPEPQGLTPEGQAWLDEHVSSVIKHFKIKN